MATAAANSLEVTAALPLHRPSRSKEMLITPYPTLWIPLPFTLFFGSMWAVFLYVVILVRRV